MKRMRLNDERRRIRRQESQGGEPVYQQREHQHLCESEETTRGEGSSSGEDPRGERGGESRRGGWMVVEGKQGMPYWHDASEMCKSEM